MGTMAEKLNKVIENKDAIKQALETPSNVMSEYSKWIEKYVQNQPTQIVTDGNCTNALDVPLVSMGVDGNSEQQTYEGYNELKNTATSSTIKNVLFTVNEDKSILVNGKNDGTGNSQFFISKTQKLSAGTYLFNGCANGGARNTYRMGIQDEKYNTLAVDTGSGSTFILTEEKTLYVFIVIQSGLTINNLIFKPMIIKGTEEKSYEPYVGGQPSPNPDYPQDIEVIDGVNLFDGIFGRYDIVNETGMKANYGSENHLSTDNYMKVDSNEDYTVSHNHTFSNSSGVIKIMEYDKDYKFISRNNASAKKNTITFKTNENCQYIKVTIYDEGGVSEIKLQITKGTTSKPYLPYGHIGLRQSGKNLLDKNQGQMIAYKLPRTLKPSTYIISCDNTGANIGFRLSATTDTSNNSIANSGNFTKGDRQYLKITTTFEANYINVSGNTSLNNIMLEEGTEATSYEPYHEPVIHPINLNGNSIAKVGDVKDLLKIYRNGDVEIGKKNRKVILEKISFLSSGTIMGVQAKYASYNLPDMKYGGRDYNFLSNKISPANETFGKYKGYTNQKVFIVMTTADDTLENFNANIAGSIIEYQLAEPETIKLPSIDPIELWEGTNKFELITNLDTTFEVEYVEKV